ncbi:MAG: hypothetical protein ACRD2R_08045 [Terriglobales bacterium]
MPARRIGIVAAMERELWPLARKWPGRTIEHEGRRFRLLEQGTATLIFGGIGAGPARRAARALLKSCAPEVLVSAGFAGALQPEGKVGDVVVPAVVRDASSGAEFRTAGGSGNLVSAPNVHGPEEKRELAARFNAVAMDMEAAAVAEQAVAGGVEFLAVKAVSDELDFVMPPVGRFVDAAGRFQTALFLGYSALRPRLWPAVVQLADNTALAADGLSRSMERLLGSESWGEELAVAAHRGGLGSRE